MNLTLLDLTARQEQLAAEINSIRWRVFKDLATPDDRRRLRELEAEFAANNAKLKRRKPIADEREEPMGDELLLEMVRERLQDCDDIQLWSIRNLVDAEYRKRDDVEAKEREEEE